MRHKKLCVDNDTRHTKTEKIINEHTNILNSHSDNFCAMASVTTMLIENINMQLEAELCDMNDRRLMGLYGAQLPSNDKVQLEDVT